MLNERGYFWWSDTKIPDGHFAPDDAVSGTLKISDRGNVTIELEGVLPGPHGPWGVINQGKIGFDKAITGLLHSGNRSILAVQLFRNGGRVSTGGFSSEIFSALYCFISQKRLPKYPKIKSLVFDLSGYEDWLRLGRLERKQTARSITLKHRTKPDLKFKSAFGNARLMRILEIEGKGTYGTGGTNLIERARLEFTPPRHLDLISAVGLFGAIQDLLILLTNSEYQMDTPSVALTSRQEAEFYFSRTISSKAHPTSREEVTSFPQIEPIFGDIMFTWLKTREELGAGAYLYLATRRGLDIYEEHRFLNLITGLEVYHRAQKGDGDTSAFQQKLDRITEQISKASDRSWLRKRLKNQGGPSLEGRLIDLLGEMPLPLEKGKLNALLGLCAKVRNQIAHQGRSSEADASGQPLSWLSLHSNILSRLYHARLLLDVGVPNEIVERWLKTKSQLPWYLERVRLLLE